MPARAHAVKVIATRLGTVAVKVNADQPTPAAPRTPSAHVRERQQGGGVDGRGAIVRERHARR